MEGRRRRRKGERRRRVTITYYCYFTWELFGGQKFIFLRILNIESEVYLVQVVAQYWLIEELDEWERSIKILNEMQEYEMQVYGETVPQRKHFTQRKYLHTKKTAFHGRK